MNSTEMQDDAFNRISVVSLKLAQLPMPVASRTTIQSYLVRMIALLRASFSIRNENSARDFARLRPRNEPQQAASAERATSTKYDEKLDCSARQQYPGLCNVSGMWGVPLCWFFFFSQCAHVPGETAATAAAALPPLPPPGWTQVTFLLLGFR